MTISNFGAAGVKPGVCTSTTRPTTPYNGQVIYETDTGYLRVWDGSAWDYLSIATDYQSPTGYLYRQTLYVTGTSTFTKATYPWLRAIRAKVVGGGGAGGGAPFTGVVNQAAAGGGGGAGGYSERLVTNIAGLATNETITIGAAGAGGSGGGGNGGASSAFGMTANGGSGGSVGVASTARSLAQGGNGGSASGGDLNISGQNGSFGQVEAPSAFGGNGGSSFMGMGGLRIGTIPATPRGGGSPTGFGAGGGGSVGAESVAVNGTSGTAGIVIIELYA